MGKVKVPAMTLPLLDVSRPHTVYTPKIEPFVFFLSSTSNTSARLTTRPGLGDSDRAPYLFVAQSRDRVDVLLLDHEGGQVGCVRSQEDDGKEGPDQDHDLAGGALWILNGDRVVEDNSPQQPHRLPNSEGGTSGIWQTGLGISQQVVDGVG